MKYFTVGGFTLAEFAWSPATVSSCNPESSSTNPARSDEPICSIFVHLIIAILVELKRVIIGDKVVRIPCCLATYMNESLVLER